MRPRGIGFAFLMVALGACSTAPQRSGLPQYTGLPLVERPSVNFGARRPNYVIIHHTSEIAPRRRCAR